MKWNDFLGHHAQRTWFQNAISQGRLGNTFLLVGPEGVGKRTFARMVAKTLLCHNADPSRMEPCDRCEACTQVEASTHPDLLQIAKPSDKSVIPMELLVGSAEARMREGLCHDIHLKPYSGRHKIAIIDDADALAQEGANCLLKTLEEPPPGAVLFLISTSEQRQMPTIRSRSQIVRFQTLDAESLRTLLNRHGWNSTMHSMDDTIRLAQGSLKRIEPLLDNELCAFRLELFKQLSCRPMNFVMLAKAVHSNVDSVGKEGAERRDRLRMILGFATDYYRVALYALSGHETSIVEASVQTMIGETVSQWPRGVESAAGAIVRCMKAATEVDRNVSAAVVLEAWSADVARICNA